MSIMSTTSKTTTPQVTVSPRVLAEIAIALASRLGSAGARYSSSNLAAYCLRHRATDPYLRPLKTWDLEGSLDSPQWVQLVATVRATCRFFRDSRLDRV